MTEMTLWSLDFAHPGKVFLFGCIAMILFFLYAVRGTKPFDLRRLLCGVFFIAIGGFTLYIALGNKELMDIFFSTKEMTNSAHVEGRVTWGVIQISIPALSYGFGLRFIGDWFTAEAPPKEGRADIAIIST